MEFCSFYAPGNLTLDRHREGCSRNKVCCLQIGSRLQSRAIKKSAQIVEPAENNAAVIERIYPFCPPVCVNGLILFSSVYHTFFFIIFFHSHISFFVFAFRAFPATRDGGSEEWLAALARAEMTDSP